MSRFASAAAGKASMFGHKYRLFGFTDDTLKSNSSMTTWCIETEWFEAVWMYEIGENGRRGKKKHKAILSSTIQTKCASRMKVKRKNLTKFMDDIDDNDISVQDQSKWCREHSGGFRPSPQKLEEWRENGYGLPQIMYLVHKTNKQIKNDLKLNPGTWQSLLELHDEIVRGDIDISDIIDDINDNGRGRRVAAGGNNNNNNNNNNINNDMNDVDMKNNNDNDMNMNEGVIVAKNRDATNCHIVKNITRKDHEFASNYGQRCRGGRKHPYVKLRQQKEYIIHRFKPDTKELPQFRSSLGIGHIYDETSDWFKYDQSLVKFALLYPHNLTKLHKRLYAQRALTQNGFTNSRLEGVEQNRRISGGDEYLIAMTILEYLNLVYRVREEANAYNLNITLIKEDDLEGDYQIGEWNVIVEGSSRSRLPRSKKQLDALAKKGKLTPHGTYWYGRNDIFKMHDSMERSDKIEEWKALTIKWEKWGLKKYFKKYVIEFFPGKEALGQRIGLFEDERYEDINLIGDVDDEKDNDVQMSWM